MRGERFVGILAVCVLASLLVISDAWTKPPEGGPPGQNKEGPPGQNNGGGQETPWGVDRIDAAKAWDTGITGSDINVAVIDTGVDKTHEDLVGKTSGINFVGVGWPGNDDYDDTGGHGTMIAGIIAANDNELGIVGVAPGVNLYSVRVRANSGTIYPDNYPNHGNIYDFPDLCEGMKWCVAGLDGVLDTGDEFIDVINFSLGTWTINNGQREDPLHDSDFYYWVQKAYERNIIMVSAAGNQSRRIEKINDPLNPSGINLGVDYVDAAEPPIYDFPPSYHECITISATAMKTTGKPSERGDIPASFTSYGPAIWVSAPGASIYSTRNNGGYGTGNGTSYAAPHVVGVVALLLASGTSPANVGQALMDSAEDLLDLGPGGWDEYYGYGLVDAGYAIAGQRAPARPHIVSPVGKLSVTWGELKGK